MGYDPCHGQTLADLRRTGDFAGWIGAALATAPGAELIYLAHEIVTAADGRRRGPDRPRACRRAPGGYLHAPARDAESLRLARRLVGLKADQITTDDPEGLCAALTT